MAKYTVTSYTSNGAKAIHRDLDVLDAKSITETASLQSYAEMTYGKFVIYTSKFVPSWADNIDRSHLV